MIFTNNAEAEATISQELLPNEKLLWCDKPQTGIKFRRKDIALIPFSILWCVGVGYQLNLFNSLNFGTPVLFFQVFQGVFALVGVYLLAGRFIIDNLQRGKTYYAVTTNRIIIKRTLLSAQVQTFNIKQLPNLSINENTDKSGTIKLESASTYTTQTLYDVNNYPAFKQRTITPALEFITNVRDVYNLILQQQAH
jgi:hypothetical protein